MTLKRSHDLNQAKVLFLEGESEMMVGQPLYDHTQICIALDWLDSYVKKSKTWHGVVMFVLRLQYHLVLN